MKLRKKQDFIWMKVESSSTEEILHLMKQLIRKLKNQQKCVTKIISLIMENVNEPIPTKTGIMGTIHIKTHERHLSINLRHLLFCRAEGSYTRLFVEGFSSEILISQSLTKFQRCIPKENFLRCHNSYLFNLQKVESFSSKKKIIVFEGIKIPISRRRCNNIFNILLDSGIQDVKNGSQM